MKVLFLDIDGVCNSLEYAHRNNMNLWNKTDPALNEMVQRIIKETDCKVVLSSTWRLYPDSRAAVRRDVCKFIDCTISLQTKEQHYGVEPRGLEIQDWLDKHPAVKQYAILDDNDDMLPHQWLFKTTFEKGLTTEITEAVIAHLNAAID